MKKNSVNRDKNKELVHSLLLLCITFKYITGSVPFISCYFCIRIQRSMFLNVSCFTHILSNCCCKHFHPKIFG
uniref:Uncharacterized protein n=1 Tax=Mus musculus TaxID=10090 RepID=Q3U1G8_MOUSE|nr:unnamed protein product [Mus musculus]